MTEEFVDILRGGHPNSLGRTGEVVDLVLTDEARLAALFATINDPDEVVRLRVGDALEKICRDKPEWFVPHVDLLLDDIGQIDQPSVQWHVAQMLDHLRCRLSPGQQRCATELLQRNLATSTDWIVLNVTMDVLVAWSAGDRSLTAWLAPELERLQHDRRTSVARRASRHRAELTGSS